MDRQIWPRPHLLVTRETRDGQTQAFCDVPDLSKGRDCCSNGCFPIRCHFSNLFYHGNSIDKLAVQIILEGLEFQTESTNCMSHLYGLCLPLASTMASTRHRETLLDSIRAASSTVAWYMVVYLSSKSIVACWLCLLPLT